METAWTLFIVFCNAALLSSLKKFYVSKTCVLNFVLCTTKFTCPDGIYGWLCWSKFLWKEKQLKHETKQMDCEGNCEKILLKISSLRLEPNKTNWCLYKMYNNWVRTEFFFCVKTWADEVAPSLQVTSGIWCAEVCLNTDAKGD